MPLELIIALIILGTGAAFCFVMAGALANERSAPSNAADMLNLFGITPDNADQFMWPVDSAA